MIDLQGIIPPLPTSFHDNEELYPKKMESNIKHLLSFDLAGILVLGSNGELVMLSDVEREKVYSVARESIPSGKLMIAGTGRQSTRETIKLSKIAASRGADAVLVLNPFYYKGLMNREALIYHYHKLADNCDVPVIIYNMPASSGMDMDAETIISIASHPNIIGLKDSGGDLVKMAEIINRTDDKFRVLAGSASFLLPALSAGATGGILGLANISPGLCLDIYKAFYSGDLSNAEKLQKQAIPLNTAVTRQWGIPALKAAMDHLGCYGGPARKPLMPLHEDRKQELFSMLD